MAITLSGLNTSMTPNTVLSLLSTNFGTVETAVNANTLKLTGVVGTAIGAANEQELTNKTITSDNRDGSKGNIFDISRKDIGDNLFKLTAYTRAGVADGIINNVDVNETEMYNLMISGGNGVKAQVASNVLKLTMHPTAVLTDTVSMVVGNATLTSGFEYDYAGTGLFRDKLGIGYHTSALSANLHIKPTAAENNITTKMEVSTSYSITETKLVGASSSILTWNGTTLTRSVAGTSIMSLTAAAMDIAGNITCSGNLGGTFIGTLSASATLASNLIDTAQIQDLKVTEAKLAAGSVTNSKLGTYSVTGAKLNPSIVGNSMQYSSSVINVKVANSTLITTTSGLQVNTLTTAELPITATSGIATADYIWTGDQISAAAQTGWHGDTTRIILAPGDFINSRDPNDDTYIITTSNNDYWLMGDTYIKAVIPIPVGYRATGACAWGSSADLTWAVFQSSVKTYAATTLLAYTPAILTGAAENIIDLTNPSDEKLGAGFDYVTMIVRNAMGGSKNFYGATVKIEKV